MENLETVNNSFNIAGHTINDPWATLISLGLIVLLGLIALKIVLMIIRHLLKKSSHVDDMLNSFFVSLTRVSGGIIIAAICLDKLGVNAGTIVAVLGAAGAAIALALKDSLANVAGGLMIIVTQPFNQGDLINVGEFRGRVQKIDLFLTTLRTLDYKIITVPNGIINTSVLVNESREDRRRVDLEFSISYDSDIEKAKEILASVCDEAPLVIKDPQPIIGVKRHDDSAIVLDLMAWCRTEDFFDTGYYLKEEIKTAFDREGIDIPFPHMEVRIEGEK